MRCSGNFAFPDFIMYFIPINWQNIQFNYSGKNYEIQIIDVYVFPQCYAAIADKLREYGRENLIVDIGSKTIDVIHTRNYVPVESESTSIPAALIQCMEGIKSNVYQNCNRRVSEDMIQQMILEKDVNIPIECKEIIKALLSDEKKNYIAEQKEQNIPEGTIAARIHHCRKNFSKVLIREGFKL